MNKQYSFSNSLSRDIESAAESVIGNYANNIHSDEPAISSAFCQAVCSQIDDRGDNIQIRARTNRSAGVRNEEAISGADILIRFEADFSDFSMKSGVFVQAKRIESSSYPNREKLSTQCHKMLRWTPASFVFIYSEENMTVIPAASIIGANELSENVRGNFYYKNIYRLHKEIFNGTIGDRRVAKLFESRLEAESVGITNYLEVIVGDDLGDRDYNPDEYLTEKTADY